MSEYDSNQFTVFLRIFKDSWLIQSVIEYNHVSSMLG